LFSFGAEQLAVLIKSSNNIKKLELRSALLNFFPSLAKKNLILTRLCNFILLPSLGRFNYIAVSLNQSLTTNHSKTSRVKIKSFKMNLQSKYNRTTFLSNVYPSDKVKDREEIILRMFGNLTRPFVAVDRKGLILFANQAFLARTSSEDRNIKGHTLCDVLVKNSTGQKILTNIRKVFLRGKAEEVKEIYSLPNLQGSFSSINFPIRDQQGTLIAAGKIILTESSDLSSDLGHQKGTAAIESSLLDSMTKFSAGLGHDVANILLPVDIRLRLIEKELERILDETEQKRAVVDELSKVRCSLGYLRSLSDDLLNVSQFDGKKRCTSKVDLDLWQGQATGLLRTFLPDSFELVMQVDPLSINLAISSAQLTQIVFNLVQNSFNAMQTQSKGKISVNVKGLASEKAIQLSISDNGPGMSEEVQKKCFEPFYSTKLNNSSSGLGLTFVQMIVLVAGGSICLQSKEQFGTTFEIVIPYS
jgi:signal transduction histidine kinase